MGYLDKLDIRMHPRMCGVRFRGGRSSRGSPAPSARRRSLPWAPQHRPRQPAHRALLETSHGLRAAHTAWVQRIQAVFFHRGAPPLAEGMLRTEQDLAALRAAAAAHLSAAGQQQVATALGMLAATEAQLGPLRHQLAQGGAAEKSRRGSG